MKPIKIFISHKRKGSAPLPITSRIADRLEALFDGENVFLDVRKIPTASKWTEYLEDSLRQADVFVLLLRKDMKNSEWIKFEVGMVHALQIGMLLVLTEHMSDEEVNEIESELGIDGIQRFNNDTVFDETESQYNLLKRDIEQICKQTRAAQDKWIRQLAEQREPEFIRADPRLIVESVSLTDWGYPMNCEFHLAEGDITDLRSATPEPAFDVIVNSENHYMQMARVFESGLSAALRRGGAQLDKHHQLIKDTVQDELDLQIRKNKLRPIMDRSVIVTHAGDPKSTLVKSTGARYIFHAAAVRVDPVNNRDRVDSLVSSEDSMRELIHRCFERVNEVNDNKGVVFPEGTPEYAQDKDASATYAPIRSIIFPIFGTGHGGASVEQAITNILKAIKSYPRLNPIDAGKLTLMRIYLCAYFEQHTKIASEAMHEVLRPRA